MKRQEQKLWILLKKFKIYIFPWHCLNFFPEPHGHFSFLPTFLFDLLSTMSFFSFSLLLLSKETTILRFNRNLIKSFFIFNNKPSNNTKASFLNSDKGSFWPYCLSPITCLSCSRYCKCDLHEKSIICKNIFFSRILFQFLNFSYQHR